MDMVEFIQFMYNIRNKIITGARAIIPIQDLISRTSNRPTTGHTDYIENLIWYKLFIDRQSTLLKEVPGRELIALYKKWDDNPQLRPDIENEIIDVFYDYIIFTGTVIELLNMLVERNKINLAMPVKEKSMLKIKFNLCKNEDEYRIVFWPIDEFMSDRMRRKPWEEYKVIMYNNGIIKELNIEELKDKLIQLVKIS